jgi:hypothetical protein
MKIYFLKLNHLILKSEYTLSYTFSFISDVFEVEFFVSDREKALFRKINYLRFHSLFFHLFEES